MSHVMELLIILIGGVCVCIMLMDLSLLLVEYTPPIIAGMERILMDYSYAKV